MIEPPTEALTLLRDQARTLAAANTAVRDASAIHWPRTIRIEPIIGPNAPQWKRPADALAVGLVAALPAPSSSPRGA